MTDKFSNPLPPAMESDPVIIAYRRLDERLTAVERVNAELLEAVLKASETLALILEALGPGPASPAPAIPAPHEFDCGGCGQPVGSNHSCQCGRRYRDGVADMCPACGSALRWAKCPSCGWYVGKKDAAGAAA